jgi:hypothetical protein
MVASRDIGCGLKSKFNYYPHWEPTINLLIMRRYNAVNNDDTQINEEGLSETERLTRA